MTDLRILLNPETSELVDRLLGDFLFSCIGKNDMAVVSAFLASAAMLITTHCDRTGRDFGEVASECKSMFELALQVSNDMPRVRR
jgi:hypothetical protein